MTGEAGRSPGAGLRVRRRDGRVVPFDAARIEAAVGRAQGAVRDRDPAFARNVAEVVGLTAAGRDPEAVLDLEEVQDLVERALIEMGRASVAKAYILYRDRRARRRSALEVRTEDEPGTGLEVAGPARTRPFERARMVAGLVEDGDLSLEHAEQVAQAVERRLLDAGLRQVTPRLLRALRDVELASMGLRPAAALEPISVLPDHVRALFERAGTGASHAALDLSPPGGDPATVLGRELVEEWGRGRLGESLDEDLLWLEDGGRGPLPLVRCLPAELLRPRGRARGAMDLLPATAATLARCGGTLVVEQLGEALAPVLRSLSRRSQGPALRDLLVGLSATARAAERRVELSRPGGRSLGGFGAHLLRESAALMRAGEEAPRLFLTWDELAGALFDDPTLRDAADEMVRRGRLVPVWGAKSERWAGPGCRRRVDEGGALALGAVVALNLPRLARRAGPWREERLCEELVALVERAVDLLARHESDVARRGGSSDLSERRVHALTPVGLAEALVLLGDGFASADSGALLVGVLDEAARRLADARGLAACVTPFGGLRAAARFAAADGEGRRLSQPRLFADLPRPEEDTGGEPYSSGFDLRPARTLGGEPGGSLEATLLGTLPSGCLSPFVALEGAPVDPEDRHPALTAWERFDRLRRPGTRKSAVRPLPSLPAADAGPLFRAAQGELPAAGPPGARRSE